MSFFNEKLTQLNEMLFQETDHFDISQKIQFDWLETIKSQIDYYSQTKNCHIKESTINEPQNAIVPNIKSDEEERNSTPPKNRTPNKSRDQQSAPQRRNKFTPSPKITRQKSRDEKSKIPLYRGSQASSPASNKTPKSPRNQKQTKIENDNTNSPIDVKSNLSMSDNRAVTSPYFSLASNSMKFVEDDSLLIESSSTISSESQMEEEDNEDELVPFTVAGSMRELTQSASSFREKWMEMLHQKKAATIIPKKPFKFAFDDYDEGMSENYQMSEDGEDDEDEAMYERNPVEIHGKMIPLWARGDQLLHQLKRQQRIDPDSIFMGFTADCPLQELFGTNKARWANRQDSGWWDNDRITEEEATRFKSALGLE